MYIKSLEELNDAKAAKRVVVVGGGTVGIYLAVLLCKRGHEVVVIEAGNRNLGNFDPATYACTGMPHEGIRIGRSRSLGGTSNLWGGQLVEYQRADFISRSWLPDSKWPVSFEEIAHYYQPTYENLGIPAKFIEDRKVFEELQTPVPGLPEGVEVFLTRWLKIPSLAAAFEADIQTLDNLKMLLDHTVVGFEGEGSRVRAVKLACPDGTRRELEGREFVLASGTIEIVRLLLHAAQSRDWVCPWKENHNVGAYFQDHIGGRAASVHPLDRKRFLEVFSTIVRSGHKFQPKLRLTSETLEKEAILNMQGMLHFESSISENLVFLKQFIKAAIYSRKFAGIIPFFQNLVACGRHLPPLMWRFVVQNRVFVPSGSKISFVIQSEQTPLADSRIRIDPSDMDPYGLPKVVLDWRIGEMELQSMREFALRAKRALESDGLAELRVVDDLLAMNPDYIKSLRDNYHHVGGARMGDTNGDGVVDKDLKVFGTDNLHVLGAATFRTTSNANTTFLALTFATRLAEHLDEKTAKASKNTATTARN